MISIFSLLEILTAAFLAATAQIFIKHFIDSAKHTIKKMLNMLKELRVGIILKDILSLININSVTAALLYIIALLIYLHALKELPLFYVYSIFGSVFVFVYIFSVTILRERSNIVNFVGVLLIFIGVSLLAI
ncbi:MAG: 4-amino-4-deoxy-L-arabinose-phosphoundecaprenol flippase subunit ArnF [Candidatus Micrarchaeota archaeon]|nr:MAG: 4-amino-4-deoxy-L-arabinose-phosphoundecaprenol flippase subunit ArnF [Candidatus Micrarchaeota archaeon]